MFPTILWLGHNAFSWSLGFCTKMYCSLNCGYHTPLLLPETPRQVTWQSGAYIIGRWLLPSQLQFRLFSVHLEQHPSPLYVTLKVCMSIFPLSTPHMLSRKASCQYLFRAIQVTRSWMFDTGHAGSKGKNDPAIMTGYGESCCHYIPDDQIQVKQDIHIGGPEPLDTVQVCHPCQSILGRRLPTLIFRFGAPIGVRNYQPSLSVMR